MVNLPVLSSCQPALRVGMLSTVPPTSCGIATFAAALARGISLHDVEVMHVDAGAELHDASSAVCALGAADRHEIDAVAAVLNACDATIVQHEYGIYPGPDGVSVLDIVSELTNRVTVVAHTVLSHPSDSQQRILTELCAEVDLVVVMTDVARERLISLYDVPADRVTVIPHGAAVAAGTRRADRLPSLSPRLLTWGLLGPGKGIEWSIEAFARLAVPGPQPHYVIAGATHPNVKARDGEAYRKSLMARAERLGVGDRVIFDDAYRSVGDLTELITTADLVVLPYDSVDQVTSGVLVDAVAAGRPVVSTAFPHAIELLGTGAGIVVPQRDVEAMVEAIERVLNNPVLAASMEDESRRLAPSLSWSAVATSYLEAVAPSRRPLKAVSS